jgi:hypothetical protein
VKSAQSAVVSSFAVLLARRVILRDDATACP